MYKLKNNIILKNKSGIDGCYLYGEGSAVYFQNIEGGALRGAVTTLCTDAASDFDAAIDRDGNIHIVFGDSGGNIVYIRKSGEKWEKGYILRAKENSDAKIGSIFFLPHSGTATIVYVIRRRDEAIVCRQILDGKIENPQAIDCIAPKSCIFAALDKDGKTAVLYREKISGNIGIRKFGADGKVSGDFRKIAESTAEIQNAFILCGENGSYFCFKTDDEIRLATADGHSKLLTKRHRGECTPFVLNIQSGRLRLEWGHGKKVISAECDVRIESWQHLREDFYAEAKRISVFKVCDAYTQNIDYRLGYLKENKTVLCGGVLFEKREQNEEQIPLKTKEMPKVNPTRQKIEEEKKKIAEQLGIVRNNSAELWENEINGNENYKTFRSDESCAAAKVRNAAAYDCRAEVEKLQKEIDNFRREIETLKKMLRVYVSKNKSKKNKDKNLVKVHKNH